MPPGIAAQQEQSYGPGEHAPVGADGKVLIEATNKTPRTLMGIDLQIRLVDAQGISRSYNQRLVGLSPGEVTLVVPATPRVG